MSCIDSKNCSEHLLTNEMGLDRAPIEFQKIVFLVPLIGGTKNTKNTRPSAESSQSKLFFAIKDRLAVLNGSPLS